MGDSPNPLNKNTLSRASVFGVALGAGAIVLFLILWVVLDGTGMATFQRLLLSMCVPPALIAALVGGYFLARSKD